LSVHTQQPTQCTSRPPKWLAKLKSDLNLGDLISLLISLAALDKPGTERVQALADISRLVLCCNSNETRAPIANRPNSAQLGGTPYHSPNLHLGPCSSVGMRRGTDTQTAVSNMHFASPTPDAKRNEAKNGREGSLTAMTLSLSGCMWLTACTDRAKAVTKDLTAAISVLPAD